MNGDIYFCDIPSPIGNLRLYEASGMLIRIDFETSIRNLSFIQNNYISVINSQTPLIRKTRDQLYRYFSGNQTTFDLPLHPNGTEFQKKAWRILENIPYGQTISYSEQARLMGGTQYSRAVGQANSRNPIPIIIPCHRVIGKNQKLTGYAGGIKLKKKLLQIEGILPLT